MKKTIKILKIIAMMILVMCLFLKTPVFADVGDFDSYDSGSSWDSWDSGSSWSSWDDDYDYGGSYGGVYSSGSGGSFIFVVVVIVIIIVCIYNKSKNGNSPLQYNANNITPQLSENDIVNKIKETDELFNTEEFKSWARDLFIKLQYAWSDRKWEDIRCFETNELFEQHSTQLQRYITNKQINKMERISVNWVKLLNFTQTGDKDVLSITLNSKMTDYIIDETTGNVLKGNKDGYNINTYKLTFIRKTGVKTKPGETTVNTTNCPNCGAPTEITSAGKCSYCGSVITTGEHNWVLSNLERYNG